MPMDGPLVTTGPPEKLEVLHGALIPLMFAAVIAGPAKLKAKPGWLPLPVLTKYLAPLLSVAVTWTASVNSCRFT